METDNFGADYNGSIPVGPAWSEKKHFTDRLLDVQVRESSDLSSWYLKSIAHWLE